MMELACETRSVEVAPGLDMVGEDDGAAVAVGPALELDFAAFDELAPAEDIEAPYDEAVASVAEIMALEPSVYDNLDEGPAVDGEDAPCIESDEALEDDWANESELDIVDDGLEDAVESPVEGVLCARLELTAPVNG